MSNQAVQRQSHFHVAGYVQQRAARPERSVPCSKAIRFGLDCLRHEVRFEQLAVGFEQFGEAAEEHLLAAKLF